MISISCATTELGPGIVPHRPLCGPSAHRNQQNKPVCGKGQPQPVKLPFSTSTIAGLLFDGGQWPDLAGQRWRCGAERHADFVASGERVKRFARNEFLGDLSFEFE